MVRLVQSADAGKAGIVSVADRWATWIVVIALASAGLAWLVTGELIRSVTILVVFCPCALVLATPTAIMAAIGNATRHGFLVREGDALERLASVSHLTFDKTGNAYPRDAPRGGGTQFSAGPPRTGALQVCRLRGTAVGAPSGQGGRPLLPEGRNAGASPAGTVPHDSGGRGVQAVLDGRELMAGNLELFRENGLEVPGEVRRAAEQYQREGCTVIFLGMDRKAAGFIALSDTLREDAVSTIREVAETGVVPVLLTGDHGNAAAHVAGQLGIGGFTRTACRRTSSTGLTHSRRNGTGCA